MAIPKFRKPTSVLITGGSSGIGKAIACLAIDRGANICLVARDQSKLDTTVEELRDRSARGRVIGVSASVTDPAALAMAVKTAQIEQGSIDLLINSAGISVPGYFDDLAVDDFSKQIDVNYLGTVRTIQAVLPGMKKLGHGWIVNISSVAGFKGFFGYTAYCGSKFAVAGLFRSTQSGVGRTQHRSHSGLPPRHANSNAGGRGGKEAD